MNHMSKNKINEPSTSVWFFFTMAKLTVLPFYSLTFLLSDHFIFNLKELLVSFYRHKSVHLIFWNWQSFTMISYWS